MRTAIPVQEQPARNALSVELNCANRTRKPVARVARSSVCPVFSAIKRSTQSLCQWSTGVGSEKPRDAYTVLMVMAGALRALCRVPFTRFSSRVGFGRTLILGDPRVHGTKRGSCQRP